MVRTALLDSNAQLSILTVHKSKEPFPAQIATVCRILSIDIDVCWKNLLDSGGAALPYQYNASDPRPQWALKWLLKNLQHGDIEPNSPCLYSRSWLLLRELVVRIHPSKTASLLKDYKFISLVCNTLQWLYQNHDEELLQPLSEDDGSTGTSSEDGNAKASSARTSKKRRRDGTEVAPSPRTARATIGAIDTVFLALCAAVGQLVELTKDSAQIKNFTAEHMKSALRSHLEEAARILGSALFLTNYLLQEPNRTSRRRKLAAFEGREHLETATYTFCVSNIVDLWNLRSLARRIASDNENIVRSAPIQDSPRANDMDQHAFRTHCLLPALQLLHSCREWSSSEKVMEAVTTSLEDLLITFTVLPFRASFVGTKESGKLQFTIHATALKEDLVSALRSHHYPKLKANSSLGRGTYEAQRQALKTQHYLKITYVSLLFEIALSLRSVSKSTNSKAEDLWLEELFGQLIDCAGILVTPTSTVKAHKDCTRLVGWMLQKCVDHKLQLSLSRIQSLLDQFSGFSTGNCGDTVEWSVVSLCLQIDSNAFVVPDSSGEASLSHSTPYPNNYLSALLSNISNEHFEASQNYEFLLSGIVLPLCSAFADARDLDGFIHHWIEQISVHEERRCEKEELSINIPCLWQDERLLQLVAQLAESKLTPRQLDHLASSVAKGIAPPMPSTSINPSLSLASLVILDCLFAGIYQEATLKRLAETVQSVFSMLGAHLSDCLDHSLVHKWRIWRIKTTIADRWVTLRSSPLFKGSAQSAICTASEVLNRMCLGTSPDGEADWGEELFAFRFLLHLAVIEESGTTLHFPSRTRLVSAIAKIIDMMEPFCHRISHDHFQTIKLPAYVPKWDEFDTGVKSINTLFLGCVADILISPVALSFLDAETQNRLIEQLYWCAVYQQRLSDSMPSGSIDNSWPWKMLLRADILSEHASMTSNIRKFQIEHYLAISDFSDPKHWDMEVADYTLTFRGILEIPVQALDRHQRGKIANRVLHILLNAKLSSVAAAIDHLNMLTKLLGIPNKSMEILACKAISEGKSAQTTEDVALLRLASVIDSTLAWSDDLIHCITALEKLTRLVISYIFATLDHASSTEYLQVIYYRLAEVLELGYREKKDLSSCFTAMAKELLNAYAKRRDSLSYSLGPILRTLDATRLYHLETILRQLGMNPRQWELQGAYSLKTPRQRHKLGIDLECLAGYSELLCIHPRLREISLELFGSSGLQKNLRQVSLTLHYEDTFWLKKDICGCDYLATRLAKVELLLGARDSSLHPGILGVTQGIHDIKSTKERNNLLVSVRAMMSSLGLENKKELCFGYDGDQGRCLNYSEVYVIGMALDSLKEQEVEELRGPISRTFALLCRSLFQPVGFGACMLSMQCISMIMQTYPRIITQWHIDNLLSAISTKASYLEDRKGEKHSSMIFTGLCRIFGTILTILRTNIGGRYHLVLCALQSLLRCLFIPFTTTNFSHEAPSAFTETHAAAYARVLTTLCDPTVSSVTRSRYRLRPELNDETKKAKDIAGQHLPYLIMEYCDCQLKGRLLPETKTALNPGLYAVLAVMSQEAMRTMNEAMDESARAVWKALYEDYKRFGRNGGF